MTDLEVYLHSTLDDVRELILAGGAGNEKLYAALHLCDMAHKKYMEAIGKEIQTRMAPTGPGGIHHGE